MGFKFLHILVYLNIKAAINVKDTNEKYFNHAISSKYSNCFNKNKFVNKISEYIHKKRDY